MKTSSNGFISSDWWRFGLDDVERAILGARVYAKLFDEGYCIRREVHRKEWGKQRFALCTRDATFENYAANTLYTAPTIAELQPYIKLLIGS